MKFVNWSMNWPCSTQWNPIEMFSSRHIFFLWPYMNLYCVCQEFCPHGCVCVCVCVSQQALGQTPPAPSRDGHCSGWYASYWNAFLLNIRWLSCTPMCLWLRDITLSSNEICQMSHTFDFPFNFVLHVRNFTWLINGILSNNMILKGIISFNILLISNCSPLPSFWGG